MKPETTRLEFDGADVLEVIFDENLSYDLSLAACCCSCSSGS